MYSTIYRTARLHAASRGEIGVSGLRSVIEIQSATKRSCSRIRVWWRSGSGGSKGGGTRVPCLHESGGSPIFDIKAR